MYIIHRLAFDALEAWQALGRGGGWIRVEGFHAPSGHGEGHDQIGVGDLRVVYIRIDMDCGLAGLAAAGVAQAFELRG